MSRQFPTWSHRISARTMSTPRPDRLAQQPASAEALMVGIVSAVQLYLGDFNMDRIVGETGRLTVNVDLQMNGGIVQFMDGAISFKRRVTL